GGFTAKQRKPTLERRSGRTFRAFATRNLRLAARANRSIDRRRGAPLDPQADERRLCSANWHGARTHSCGEKGVLRMIVSQMMSRNVETCRPKDSLALAAGKMWDRDVGCLPVVDEEGRVVGTVTDRDICMAAYTQGRPLDAMCVESAMAKNTFSCSPG